jgi:thiol-disulfide isomerase/thioredoxin
MSKAARLREKTARERIAAQQAAARRAEARRRMLMFGGSILAVIAIVVGFVVYYNVRSPSNSAATGAANGSALSASTVADITGVSAATLNQVRGGTVLSYQGTEYSGPPVVKISNTPLTSGGKPEMLYIGAEFCPFCAAMRWSMAVALSRFGTFTTPLRGFHSSSTDTDPSTPTLTFYKAGYTSKYLTFTPVENEDVNRNQLQAVTSSQQAVWTKYDTTTSDGVTGTGYPFIDFGNKAIITAPLYDPAVLKGLTWAQVAATLNDPSSSVAKAVDGTANYITAAICKMTGNKPGSVCKSSAVSSLESGV